MPGIRLFDVRAALAALGLAVLAALAVAVATHLPLSAPSGPPAPAHGRASSAGLSRLQSLPLQAQSVMSSTIAADNRAFAARRTASGWGLSGGGVRADFRSGEPTLSLAGGHTLSLSLAGAAATTSVSRARQPRHPDASRHPRVVRRGPARHRAGLHAGAPPPAATATAHGVTLVARRRRLAARAGRGIQRELRGIARRYRGAIWGADRGRRDRAPPAQRAERRGRARAHLRQRPRARATRSRSTRSSSRATSWCQRRA